eukprot:scaffold6926_cov100-Cylindrotheca_fusiformis.AAC.3
MGRPRTRMTLQKTGGAMALLSQIGSMSISCHGVAGKLQRQLAEANVRLLQRQRKIYGTEEFKQLNVTEMIPEDIVTDLFPRPSHTTTSQRRTIRRKSDL